jgi:Protein of unknown function (DUF3017)
VSLDQRIARALPIAAVLLVVAVALVLIATAHWRRGTAALAGAMFLGGVLRLLVPDRFIGVLAVRGKPFDVWFYFGSAFLLGALTIGVP